MENRDLIPVILLIIILVVALTGCAGAVSTQPDPTITNGKNTPRPTSSVGAPVQPTLQPESTPGSKVPELRLTQTLPTGLERVQPTESNPIVGEVPAKILDEIVADLAHKLGKDRASIEVIRAEAVVWNDGSLGCPKPGEFYIQILVNGYWVVLGLEGLEYDYRVSDTGYFFLCEGVISGDPGTDLLPDK